MTKLPVSVCIIAKNEEKYIEECLKRLQPYGFEIVVTDTGSQDRTKKIARQYASRVLDYTWTDDFSAARNFCADHASNDWIIVLDCDEYVADVDLNTLRLFMEKVPDYTGVLRLKNLVNKEDGTQGYSVDDVIRMYDRRLVKHHVKPFAASVPQYGCGQSPDGVFRQLPDGRSSHGRCFQPSQHQNGENARISLFYSR